MSLIKTKKLTNCSFVTIYKISKIIPSEFSKIFLEVFLLEKLSLEYLLNFYRSNYVVSKKTDEWEFSYMRNFFLNDICYVDVLMEVYYFDYTNENSKSTQYSIRWPLRFFSCKRSKIIEYGINCCLNSDGLNAALKMSIDKFLIIYGNVFSLNKFKLDRVKIYHTFLSDENSSESNFNEILDFKSEDGSDSDSD
jgi:hypothetical protein